MRRWSIVLVRWVQAGICVYLGVLCAVHFPAEWARMDASIAPWKSVAGTVVVAGFYFAIPLISLKELRASNLLASVFCVLFTPLAAIDWLFSGWSTASARVGAFLLYVVAGNVILFFVSVAGVVATSPKRTQRAEF